MDFRLDDQQLALQDGVRGFCARRWPLEQLGVREGRPVDRSDWRALGDLGVLGVMTPEADGGAGLGPVEAAIVLEELGSFLVSGPLVWSMLAASRLPGVASGTRIVAGLDGTVPDGEPVLVEHAADLDTLLLLRPAGVFACGRADLPEPVPMPALDPLTTIGRYPRLPEGERIAGADEAVRLRHHGMVLTAALLVGVSAAALETARSYALEREQFGVKIGSFQAIKHLLADMYVRTALARSSTYAAAALLEAAEPNPQPPDPESANPESAARAAKLLAGEAAIGNAKAAVQILGGMGFTWAMLPNYLLKRAWVLEHAFGSADAHALELGTRIGEEVG
jgi:alkylation response protein AidB-like acyl-CoA dehydrogenase